ncbi:MAG: tripartite tricarboxylate transporter substrate binding protein [Qingshengfaniella sp.]
MKEALALIRAGATAGLLATAALAVPAAAQDYPSKPIEVIHQFGPGGGTDNFIRAIGLPFEGISGVQLIPLSMAGGAGMPAAAAFAQRPANGQTLQAIGPEEVISHVLGRIDLTTYRPIARVQYDQGLFYVGKDSTFQTIEEVIDFATANPGELKVGIAGAAGFDATLVGLWNTTTGATLTAVPFKGSSEALASAMGGHTDLLYEEYGPARGVIESGELRPLVIFSEERLPELPDVPTARELGHDVTLGRWRGMAMKQADDPAHAERIAALLAEAAQTPEYKEIEAKSSLQYRSEFLGPDAFAAFLDEQIKVYSDVLSEINMAN